MCILHYICSIITVGHMWYDRKHHFRRIAKILMLVISCKCIDLASMNCSNSPVSDICSHCACWKSVNSFLFIDVNVDNCVTVCVSRHDVWCVNMTIGFLLITSLDCMSIRYLFNRYSHDLSSHSVAMCYDAGIKGIDIVMAMLDNMRYWMYQCISEKGD